MATLDIHRIGDGFMFDEGDVFTRPALAVEVKVDGAWRRNAVRLIDKSPQQFWEGVKLLIKWRSQFA